MMKQWSEKSQLKMLKVTNIMIREFKGMSKLLEDKILFEVGYRDKLEPGLEHANPAELANEILSFESIPSFASLAQVRRKMPKRSSSQPRILPPVKKS